MVMRMDMVNDLVLLVIDIDITTDFVTYMVIVIVLVIVRSINRRNIKYDAIKVKITNSAVFLIIDGGEQEKTEFLISQMKQRR